MSRRPSKKRLASMRKALDLVLEWPKSDELRRELEHVMSNGASEIRTRNLERAIAAALVADVVDDTPRLSLVPPLRPERKKPTTKVGSPTDRGRRDAISTQRLERTDDEERRTS